MKNIKLIAGISNVAHFEGVREIQVYAEYSPTNRKKMGTVFESG